MNDFTEGQLSKINEWMTAQRLKSKSIPKPIFKPSYKLVFKSLDKNLSSFLFSNYHPRVSYIFFEMLNHRDFDAYNKYVDTCKFDSIKEFIETGDINFDSEKKVNLFLEKFSVSLDLFGYHANLERISDQIIIKPIKIHSKGLYKIRLPFRNDFYDYPRSA